MVRRDWAASFWSRVAALVGGLVILVALGLIPFIGSLVSLLALTGGLGALAIQIGQARVGATAS
jgi:hypothetical protein